MFPGGGTLITSDDFQMTDPDGFGASFSSSYHQNAQGTLVGSDDASSFGGFGPGDYAGDYTGTGDRVYWGPYNTPSTVPSNFSVPQLPAPPHLGIDLGVRLLGPALGFDRPAAASSTGDTVLLPRSTQGSAGSRSQTSSRPAVDPRPALPSVQDLERIEPVPDVSPSEIGEYTDPTQLGRRGDVTSVPGEEDRLAMQDQLDQLRVDARAPVPSVERGPITETNISDSVAGPMPTHYTGTEPSVSQTQPSGTNNGDFDWRTITFDETVPELPEQTIRRIFDTGSTAETADTADTGTGSSDPYTVPSRGTVQFEDAYSGDGSSVMSRPRSLAPSEPMSSLGVPDKGLEIIPSPGEDIELADLRGPPSLHPELESDFSPSLPELGNLDDSPFLLGDMPPAPPNSVFNFDAVDWNNVDPRALDAIGDYMQSEAGTEGSYLGSDGFGQNLGLFSRAGFANFLKSRVVDLGVGIALAPLFKWIDDATDTPWVSRGIQGAMAVAGLVIGGDPFGVIAAPIIWGVQELMNQETRKLENDNPAANYGKRFGYVREGHKWYPAYLVRSERDEGWVGSDRTQIRLAYGTDLKFKRQKGTGKMIPYFDEGTYRQKDYHVWDNELDTTNEQSGKRWRDTADPLRDFYFLNEDETTEFLTKLGGGDTVSQYSDDRSHNFTKEEQDAIRASQSEAFGMMQVHDDLSWADTWDNYGDVAQKAHYGAYGQYLRTVQDVRSGLEIWQDYLTSEPGNIYTTHSDEDLYSGARAFRRVINESGYLGYPDQYNKHQMSRPTGSTAAEMQANALGRHDILGQISVTAEGRWLVEERRKAMGILYESQKRVGTTMHYDKLFGDLSKADVPDGAPGWLMPNFEAGADALSAGFYGSTEESRAQHSKWFKSKGSIDQYAWRLYLDGTWEIGDVTSDEGLADALRHIEAAGDSSLIGTSDYRSANQRDFLANKAYVRYLNGKLDQMGIAEVAPENTGEKGRRPFDTQQGFNEFGLSPTYSYADDYAEWGWSTKPTGDGTQTADFKLSSEELAQAQVKPEWMRLVDDYVIKDGLSPDQVAGRYDSADDYKTALGIISQRDPVYYAPADEPAPAPLPADPLPADPLPLAWDAWDEGVAEGVMPYDNVQRTHVSPRDKTPGLVYDPETDSYVLPGTQIAKRPDETHPAVSTVKPASAMPAATPSGQDWTGFAGSGTWDDAGYDPDFIDYGDEEPTIWEGSTRTRYERVGGTTVQDLPGSVQMDIVRYGRVGTAIEEVPETKPKVVPDIVPEAQNAHVHEEAPDDGEQPPLPVYMQEQHRDLHFQHSSAPMHLPPPHT